MLSAYARGTNGLVMTQGMLVPGGDVWTELLNVDNLPVRSPLCSNAHHIKCPVLTEPLWYCQLCYVPTRALRSGHYRQSLSCYELLRARYPTDGVGGTA
eukprot:178318-Rhodomonas_salina.4